MDKNIFDFYDLPINRIANYPLTDRDSSKLLYFCKSKNNQMELSDWVFSDLPNLLKAGDVLVINNSKVIPARFFVRKNSTEIEILLHMKQGDGYLCFAKPARKISIGDKFNLEGDLTCEIIAKNPDGQLHVKFNKSKKDLFANLEKIGHMPLPPYIKRHDNLSDRKNYQTIFAKHSGSVAAPTAGLHFTENLLNKIKSLGVRIAEVTLHVGAGTFQPMKDGNPDSHKMHEEICSINSETAKIINMAKSSGNRIIAVGSTSLRVLESVADKNSKLQNFTGSTDIFIKPRYNFKIVDCLITNFHLPKSTLLVLVAAFIGTDNMHKIYNHAINNNYRFYSYGDACFLEKF